MQFCKNFVFSHLMHNTAPQKQCDWLLKYTCEDARLDLPASTAHDDCRTIMHVRKEYAAWPTPV